MKIAWFELNQQLKKFYPIYLITGDETLLLEQCRNKILSQLKQQQFTDHIKLFAETESDWDKLALSQQTGSLFGDKSLLDVRLKSNEVGAALKSQLENFIAKPNPDCCLLLSCPKLKTAASNQAWYKALDKVGLIVNVWAASGRSLQVWLQQELAEKQLKMAPDAIKLLLEFTENNLLATQQALLHLQAVAAQQTITSKMITELLQNQSKFDVFSLIDPMLAGNKARAYRILTQLKSEQAQPALLLWSILKELVLLKNLIQATQSQSQDQLFKKYAIWPKRQPLVKQALARLRYSDLQAMLHLAYQIDYQIKTGQNQVWHDLERLCLSLAGATELLRIKQ